MTPGLNNGLKLQTLGLFFGEAGAWLHPTKGPYFQLTATFTQPPNDFTMVWGSSPHGKTCLLASYHHTPNP